MTRLLKFPLENSDAKVIVEVQEIEQRSGLVKAGRSSGDIPEADQPLEVVIRQAEPVLKAIAQTISTFQVQGAAVEFGLGINEKCELILASGDDQANFRVRLKIIPE